MCFGICQSGRSIQAELSQYSEHNPTDGDTDRSKSGPQSHRIAYALSVATLSPDDGMQSSALAFFIQSRNAGTERTLNLGAHQRKHLIPNAACAVKQWGQ